MDKVVATPTEAIKDIPDGSTIAIAGFSVGHRFANSLIIALREKGTKNLTLVCNSLGDPGATRGQILAYCAGRPINVMNPEAAKAGSRV